jgi:hypothetical protein
MAVGALGRVRASRTGVRRGGAGDLPLERGAIGESLSRERVHDGLAVVGGAAVVGPGASRAVSARVR